MQQFRVSGYEKEREREREKEKQQKGGRRRKKKASFWFLVRKGEKKGFAKKPRLTRRFFFGF